MNKNHIPNKIVQQDELDNIIINEIIPKILSGQNDDIDEIRQHLVHDYFEKKRSGKWDGKGIGYIKRSLNHKLMDYYRSIFNDSSYFNDEQSQLLSSERINDQTILLDNSLQVDNNELNSLISSELLEQQQSEINLFLPNKQVPFSKKRKQDHFQLISSKDGLRVLHISSRDKIKPYVLQSYNNKIYINGISPDNPIAKRYFIEQLKRLNQKGIINTTKKQEKYLADVKKLFFDYLNRFSRYSHTDWNKRIQFTYKDSILNFCKMNKYSGWETLNRYIKEYRNETGIQAEYYFHNQIKMAINAINEKAVESFKKYGEVVTNEYCTQTNICKYLGLKQNHGRVLYYLEYLYLAQQIKYDEDTHIYRVLK